MLTESDADPKKEKIRHSRPGRKYFSAALNPNSHQNSHRGKTKKATSRMAHATALKALTNPNLIRPDKYRDSSSLDLIWSRNRMHLYACLPQSHYQCIGYRGNIFRVMYSDGHSLI